MFHHLTSLEKQTTLKEIFRVLHPGGIFLLLDFGPPRGAWAWLASSCMALLEEVADHRKGLLIPMMRSAGFHDIREGARFSTMFGTLSLYSARKL
jgi:SAM-dependent methyltransferase